MKTADQSADQGFFVTHPVGRVLLSALLAGFVVTLVAWNLPDGEVQDDLAGEMADHVNALHINQSWALFSPNPSTTTVEAYAEVTFADGSSTEYRFPDGDPFVGALREYRWRKFERRLRLDSNRYLWEPTARWIADRYDEPVESVVLIRRWSTTPEPGSGQPREWQEFAFYTLEVST